MAHPCVAVVDLGSNSLKLLVAARAADGRVVATHFATIDARLGRGLTAARPLLAAAAQEAAIAAATTLVASARTHAPAAIRLVATSAVRDAANGADFAAAVTRACGLPVRILTGDEEAALIGRGLLCDPAIAAERDFEVFDLGGGSLECLAFVDRRVVSAASVPLGCVRLMEAFVPEPAAPFPEPARAAIARQVRAVLTASPFAFRTGPRRLVLGTGGTLTTLRAIAAAEQGVDFEAGDPRVSVATIAARLQAIGGAPLAVRRHVAGLPPARADVFPTALATLLALAEFGGITEFRTSVYNLRFGVAAAALDALDAGETG